MMNIRRGGVGGKGEKLTPSFPRKIMPKTLHFRWLLRQNSLVVVLQYGVIAYFYAYFKIQCLGEGELGLGSCPPTGSPTE